MSKAQDPYASPVAPPPQARRFQFRSLLVVYVPALVAVVAMYFVGERAHLADEVTDFKLFLLALPYLLAVAAMATAVCAPFAPRKVLGQVCAGLVLGPMTGPICFALYPVVHRALVQA